MICRVCGELIPDSSKFCPKCGAQNPDLYANQKNYEHIAEDSTASPSDCQQEPAPASPTVPQAANPSSYPPPQSNPQPYSYGPGPQQPGGVPPYGGQPPQQGYAPLPYSTPNQQPAYYQVPIYQQPKKHTGVVVAIVAIVVVALIASIGFLASTIIRDVPVTHPADGTDNYPYQVGDTVTATGEHVDALFEECTVTSEITLKEFLTGAEANAEMVKLGADLSLLDRGQQYALARFEVKLLRSDSSSPVRYSDYDFYLYDYDLAEYCTPVADEELYPESIQLTEGQTGEVTIFAVVNEDSDVQSIYFTQDGYICFAKDE